MKKRIVLSVLIITIAMITIYSVINNKKSIDENRLIVDFSLDKTWEWDKYSYKEYPLHIEIYDNCLVRITAVVKRNEYSYSEIIKISSASLNKIKSLFINYNDFATPEKTSSYKYRVYDTRLKIKVDRKLERIWRMELRRR